MASIETSEIKHEGIRGLMERCAAAMSEDDFDTATRSAADAYLLVLSEYPAVREALQAVLDNEIVEKDEHGNVTRVRFKAAPAVATPQAMTRQIAGQGPDVGPRRADDLQGQLRRVPGDPG